MMGSSKYAFRADDLDTKPLWLPAVVRGGFDLEQVTQPGMVTGWDMVVPRNQEIVRDVAALTGLPVYRKDGGRWEREPAPR